MRKHMSAASEKSRFDGILHDTMVISDKQTFAVFLHAALSLLPDGIAGTHSQGDNPGAIPRPAMIFANESSVLLPSSNGQCISSVANYKIGFFGQLNPGAVVG